MTNIQELSYIYENNSILYPIQNVVSSISSTYAVDVNDIAWETISCIDDEFQLEDQFLDMHSGASYKKNYIRSEFTESFVAFRILAALQKKKYKKSTWKNHAAHYGAILCGYYLCGKCDVSLMKSLLPNLLYEELSDKQTYIADVSETGFDNLYPQLSNDAIKQAGLVVTGLSRLIAPTLDIGLFIKNDEWINGNNKQIALLERMRTQEGINWWHRQSPMYFARHGSINDFRQGDKLWFFEQIKPQLNQTILKRFSANQIMNILKNK